MFYYNHQFNVKNDKKSIQFYVKKFINRGQDIELNPKIINVIQLGESNTYIALFQVNENNMGFAHLKKGLNNKMQIISTEQGDNKVSYYDIKTNKGIFSILRGNNHDLNIDHISVKLMNENYNFTVNVSDEKYFLKYKKLPESLTNTFPAKLTFYDKNDNILN